MNGLGRSWAEVVRLGAADPGAPPELYVPTLRPVTFGRRRARSKVATAAHAGLPLHAKSVAPLNLAALLRDMRPDRARRLRTMLAQLKTHGSADTTAAPFEGRWRVPLADLPALLASGVLATFQEADAANATRVRYFSVVEIAKSRRRPIMWPFDFLKNSTYLSELSLPAASSYTRLVNEVRHACCFDLASSFWQVELPEDCVFVMEDESGQRWRVTRVPFGVDSGAEILQVICEELAHIAAARAGVVDRMIFRVHIDNVFAGSPTSPDDVSAWSAAFANAASHYGVTLNDEPQNAVSSSVDFAGIVFDFAQRVVRLRDSFVASIPPVVDALASFETLESAVGKLMYGAAVLHLRLHVHHFFFKWYRRQLSRLCIRILESGR